MTTPQDPFASPSDDRGSTPPQGSSTSPPAGWGAPGEQSDWGGHPGPPPQGNSNGVGVAALVVGLLALFTSWLLIGGLLGIVAIVLGIVGLGKVKRHEASNKGMAIAGIVLGALSVLATGAILALFGWVLSSDAGQDLAECLEQAGGDASAQAECQRQFEDTLTG